jgi:ribonuclease-3
MALKSPKSRLQEETQRMSGERPDYRLLEAVGPDHEKVFRVEVSVGDEVIGMGVGPSRRVAETAAAAEAVQVLAARAAESAAEGGEAVAASDDGDGAGHDPGGSGDSGNQAP